ncbi:MAG: hypothetical protein MZV70_43435 [Desulfobacterales bacterium]|nr:hypothetical protein [Desulfobacterales bacterium]
MLNLPRIGRSEGADIGKQTHMVKLFKTHKPVMMYGSFRSVEGPHAVVIHHPVFSSGHRFAGSVSALFATGTSVIEYHRTGRLPNLPVDIYLIQTDGLMIYDMDIKQIGLSMLRDPLFQPFPELIALAGKDSRN